MGSERTPSNDSRRLELCGSGTTLAQLSCLMIGETGSTALPLPVSSLLRFSKLLSLCPPATKCHQPLCSDTQQLWQKDGWIAAGVYWSLSLICLHLIFH